MNVSGRFLLRLTERLRGSQVRKILRSIGEEPLQPRPRILEGQFLRLSRLLASAEAHVPYYREMFRSLGMHSSDIRNLKDLALLPILTKDIIRERIDDLVREDIPKSDLIPRCSGGSTGVPLRFYRSGFELDACEAGIFRNWRQAGWEPGEMVAYFWGFDDQLYGMSTWEFELRQRLRRSYQFDPFQSGPEQMERWRLKFRQIRPALAMGYASTIARFAEHVENTGQRLRPLRGVFTTAEKLYPRQQETIARVFGCPVFDLYGSSEVNNIACSCAHGKMHLNSDFAVVEVDDTNVAPGQPPSLIVTSLWGETMPFIRYRNEDCGELLEGTCDCGSQFPLMKLNIARISDNFTLPNGQVVHGEFFTHLMYGSVGISSFQFHQTATDAITLWIVPGPGEPVAREEAIRSAASRAESIDPTGTLRVQVRQINAIPLSSAGKHRFTRSDVSPGAASRSFQSTGSTVI
jgi:phenylacetate-coenzyme A ligase PaaK-like adenylate-forming protein